MYNIAPTETYCPKILAVLKTPLLIILVTRLGVFGKNVTLGPGGPVYPV